MKNFNLKLPTEVIFGKDIEAGIGAKIKELGGTKVLIHYGGGSVKASGLFQKVTNSLQAAGLAYEELGGVEPNPKLSFVRKGIAFCKEHDIDFLLAVGGGSVIDSTKSIAMGLANETDVWEIIASGVGPKNVAPFGVVLTLSAAGSETSNSQVITNEENQKKIGLGYDGNRPLFAFMNPENTYSVSKYQTGCGVVDIMMHTMERYFTPDENSYLTDDMAQGLLRGVLRAGSVAIANPSDYDARATIMWAGSVSHNGLFAAGKTMVNMPAHKMEHAVSGEFDQVAHGAGLAVLFPAWASFVCKQHPAKFAKFAKEVMDICPEGKTETELGLAGIEALKAYYTSIGMPVTFAELGLSEEAFAPIIDSLMDSFPAGVPSYGSFLNREDLAVILNSCK